MPGRYRLYVLGWVTGFMIGAAGLATAEPYLAIREGLKCSACHTNLTGQGKRNLFGVEYAQKSLPMKTISDSTVQDVLSQYMSETFSIGIDFRMQNVSTKATPNTDPPGHQFANSFLINEAELYAEINLVQGRLTVYLDERIVAQPGAPADSREVMGMIRGLPLKGHVKVGKMYTPYGLRIWDSEALILTKTDLLNSEFGIGVGAEPGPFSFHAAVQNGEPVVNVRQNTAKQVTASLTAISRYGRIGGSFNHNPKGSRLMGGGFLGAGYGPIVLLGEFDFMRFSDFNSTGRTLLQYIGYGEINFRVRRGLHLKAAYDYFDGGFVGGDQRRYQGGVEFRPIPFMQARVLYTHGRPSVLPGGAAGIGNGDRLLFELHFFL